MIYKGQFQADLMHGFGELHFPSGEQFKGSFVEGKAHGKGTHYYATGSKFIGSFHRGREDGEGRILYANGLVDAGRWKDGLRVDSDGYEEMEALCPNSGESSMLLLSP